MNYIDPMGLKKKKCPGPCDPDYPHPNCELCLGDQYDKCMKKPWKASICYACSLVCEPVCGGPGDAADQVKKVKICWDLCMKGGGKIPKPKPK